MLFLAALLFQQCMLFNIDVLLATTVVHGCRLEQEKTILIEQACSLLLSLLLNLVKKL